MRKYLILSAILSFAFAGAVSASTINKSVTPAVNLSNGLVGWWTFDGNDVSATKVLDKSGNNNNCTRTNLTVGSGKIGQAGKFNNSILNCGNNSALTFGTGDFSLSVWVKTSTSSLQHLIGKRGAGNPWYRLYYRGDINYIYLELAPGNTVSVDRNIKDNKWHLITGTRQAGVGYIYVDGVQVASSTLVGNTDNTEPFSFGTYDVASVVNNPYYGLIDDARVYNRALSAAEITALYKLGGGKLNVSPTNKPNLNSGLVGWWTFDGNDMSATQVKDKSGNNNNCTRTNLTVGSGKIGQAGKFAPSSYCTFSSAVNLGTVHTVTFWAKYNPNFGPAGTDQSLIQSTNGYLLDYRKSATFYYHSGDVSSFSKTIPDSNWHFYTIVRNGVNVSLYFDNVLVSTQTNQTSGFSQLISYFGEGSGTFSLSGSLDDIRAYTRILSTAEITALYKLGGGKVNVATANKPNLNSGLVGWWTFDGNDVSATKVLDKSGNGNVGTRSGGVAMTAGKIGQAGKFNGVDDNLTWTSINTGTTSTFSVWAKGNKTTVTLFSDSNNNGLFFNGTTIYFYVNGSGVTLKTGYTRDNNWHLYIITRAGAAFQLYIDGVGQGIATHAFNVSYATTRITFANWNGQLDDARIYNRALTQAEITQLYKMGK